MTNLSWQTWLVLWAAAAFVIALPWIIRFFTEKQCERCFYPESKCECPPDCDHAETGRTLWSQDGWITRCKICGVIVYVGE